MAAKTKLLTWAVLFVALLCNAVLWYSVRDHRHQWLNVPPAPSAFQAGLMALGDNQLAYRLFGFLLQNSGDTGGRVTAFRDYNYERLHSWFMMMHDLDPRGWFMPYLAAYYYGAIPDEPGQDEKLAYVVDYLRVVGLHPSDRHWFWLAHAALIARYNMQDLDLALEIAREVQNLDQDELPLWAAQMPVFIHAAKGEEEAAHDMIMNVLRESGDDMTPQDRFVLLEHLCLKILAPERAIVHPFCGGFKEDIESGQKQDRQDQ